MPSSLPSEVQVALRSAPPSSDSLFGPAVRENIATQANVQRDMAMAFFPSLLTHKDLSRGVGFSSNRPK